MHNKSFSIVRTIENVVVRFKKFFLAAEIHRFLVFSVFGLFRGFHGFSHQICTDFRTNFDVRRPPVFHLAGGVWGGGSPPSKTPRPKFRQNSADFRFFGSVFQPLS